MPDHILGLDLGQSQDPTALLVLRRSLVLTADGLPRRNRWGDLTFAYACNHIAQFALGTSYTVIVAEVSRLAGLPELRGRTRLAIDATGVGRPVVDMFLDAGMDAEIFPVTITAGDTPRRDRWRDYSRTIGYWVPKHELVSAVQALLETRRLGVYAHPLADLFRRELLEFRVKITPAANETFEARSGAHDDMVLACAIAAWLGEQREIDYAPRAEAPSLQEQRERDALQRERVLDDRSRQLQANDPFLFSSDDFWVH